MTITVTRLKRACEELREAMRDEPDAPLSHKIAMHAIASSPTLLTWLAEKLSERSTVANVVHQHINMPGVTSVEQAMQFAKHNRTCRWCGGLDRHATGCPGA